MARRSSRRRSRASAALAAIDVLPKEGAVTERDGAVVAHVARRSDASDRHVAVEEARRRVPARTISAGSAAGTAAAEAPRYATMLVPLRFASAFTRLSPRRSTPRR